MYLSKNSFLVAIFICFLGYNYVKSDRILVALIIHSTEHCSCRISFCIENGIFDEYAGCTNINIDITNKEKIIESLGMVKNCKDVEFTIWHIFIWIEFFNIFTNCIIFAKSSCL